MAPHGVATPIPLNGIVHAEADFSNLSFIANSPIASKQQLSRLNTGLSDPEDEQSKKQAEMQMWWHTHSTHEMKVSDKYTSVSVLLIKWADNLDEFELKTRGETEELQAVFRDEFNYETEIVELDRSSKPQYQLRTHLSNFVQKHDGPENLMIVYYTGHGTWTADNYLELSASTQDDDDEEDGIRRYARANWNKAEEILTDDVDGDVLTILDACFASNLFKTTKEDTRRFEALCACSINKTTASPGPNSFTRALIDALKELRKEFGQKSFSTFHLNQKIVRNPNRHNTPSILWDRYKSLTERRILLAPLKPADERKRYKALLKPHTKSYVTLRLALKHDTLDEGQIKLMTKHFADAAKACDLLKIDWLGLKRARTTHFKYAAFTVAVFKTWRRIVKQRIAAREKAAEAESNQPVPNATSPTKKRGREAGDELLLPLSKRGSIVDRPISPPLSADPRETSFTE